MTKEELVARPQDLEWEDFEVKAAKGGLPKNTGAFDTAKNMKITKEYR